ncbi:MAG TPA: signal peptidase I [Pseudogracilibacillus sp.]|nr:signal peptidase I [Pseudogracilibacillus sp.]
MVKKKSELFDWIKAIVIAVVIAFVVRAFIISPIIVDGPSMEPTLYDSDQMIVNKFNYLFNDPKRFDIVIFHATEEKDYIKRVIGLPGEHVEVKNNELYINNTKEDEYFLNSGEGPIETADFDLESLPGKYKEIPENKVLVLGDNRNNSTDSRIIGLIDIDEIVGKASFIYWPFERVRFVK